MYYRFPQAELAGFREILCLNHSSVHLKIYYGRIVVVFKWPRYLYFQVKMHGCTFMFFFYIRSKKFSRDQAVGCPTICVTTKKLEPKFCSIKERRRFFFHNLMHGIEILDVNQIFLPEEHFVDLIHLFRIYAYYYVVPAYNCRKS